MKSMKMKKRMRNLQIYAIMLQWALIQYSAFLFACWIDCLAVVQYIWGIFTGSKKSRNFDSAAVMAISASLDELDHNRLSKSRPTSIVRMVKSGDEKVACLSNSYQNIQRLAEVADKNISNISRACLGICPSQKFSIADMMHQSESFFCDNNKDDQVEELTDDIRDHLRSIVTPLDFSGKWICDKIKSDSLDGHLEALNVPWLARMVGAKASYRAEILHVGFLWQETSTTAVFSHTNELRLDGHRQNEAHPMDRTPCTCHTRLVGDRIVSRIVYLRHNIEQTLTRWMEGPNSYTVCNELKLKNGEIRKALTYFDRVTPQIERCPSPTHEQSQQTTKEADDAIFF